MEKKLSSQKTVLLVDLDNTVADTDGKLCHLLRDHIEETKQIKQRQEFEFPKEVEKWTRPLMEEKGFFLSLEPLPGAVDTIIGLCEMGVSIVFVSSPLRNAPFCEWEKRQWIQKHFGDKWGPVLARSAMIVKDKTCVRGTVLIDDKPDQGEQGLFTPEWKLVLFDQHYNASSQLTRLKGWNVAQVVHLLDSVCGSEESVEITDQPLVSKDSLDVPSVVGSAHKRRRESCCMLKQKV